MSNPDLEQEIITSEEAKAFLQMVTKGFYSTSYTGLWIYEVIGREWDELRAWTEGLKDEVNPQTCTWSVGIWEWVVGLETDESLDLNYRRQRILAKISTARPINPEVIRRSVAALIGLNVDAVKVNDLVGPYRFEVIIHPQETPLPYNRINPHIREIKPSHLSFESSIETEVNIRILIDTAWYAYEYGLTGQYEAGTHPNINITAKLQDVIINAEIDAKKATFTPAKAGTTYATADGTNTQKMHPPNISFRQDSITITAELAAAGYKIDAPPAAETNSETGRYPTANIVGRTASATIAAEIEGKGATFTPTDTGVTYATADGTNTQRMKTPAVAFEQESIAIGAEVEIKAATIPYTLTGTQPGTQITLEKESGSIVPSIETASYTVKYTMCGTTVTKSSE